MIFGHLGFNGCSQVNFCGHYINMILCTLTIVGYNSIQHHLICYNMHWCHDPRATHCMPFWIKDDNNNGEKLY